MIKPRANGHIVAVGVCRSFRGRAVLRDLDLQVGPGAVVAIVGDNGSGKTTLLRILAGTVLPDRGQVSVCGQPPGRGFSAFVPSGDRALYWRLTGRADLAFFARLSGLGAAEVLRVTKSAAAAMGAEDLLDEVVGVCSTGQRRRLVFAQGLVGMAPVLLADEPFDDLDDRGHLAVSDVMRWWADAGGVVVFAVPASGHPLPADKVFRLEGGTLVQQA